MQTAAVEGLGRERQGMACSPPLGFPCNCHAALPCYLLVMLQTDLCESGIFCQSIIYMQLILG